jgi:hypothetical protein
MFSFLSTVLGKNERQRAQFPAKLRSFPRLGCEQVADSLV